MWVKKNIFLKINFKKTSLAQLRINKYLYRIIFNIIFYL